MCSSLKGGGGELGNLKLWPMAPTKLHNIKLKQTNYGFFTMVWRLNGGLDTSQR